MKKTLGLRFAAAVVLLAGCPTPYQENINNVVPPPADAWYYEITNGVFLGGSLLYNPTNDNLNHFKNVQTVPIRLAQLNATSKTETFDVDVINMDTGAITTTTESRTETTYEEIPESVLTGSMTISAISASGLTFNYVLYDKDMNKDLEKSGETVALGETYDFNSDGLADLTFRAFDPGTRTGFDSSYEVAFLSDKDSTPPHTTMHKAPDDPSFPFPSGIITVTPSGKLVLQSENFAISNQDADTISLTGANIPSLSRQDYIVDLTRDNGDDLDKGAIRAIDTITPAGNTVTFETADIPAQSAYEVMNLTLVGNVEDLSARYLRSDSRSLAGGSNQRSIYVSLLNLQGTHNFPLPAGITGSAQLEYLLKLGLYMDARTSFNWDKVSASATFYVDSAARAVISAYVSQTFGFGFRHVLANPSVGFFVGPVPVDVNAEIAIGADVNFSASGRFRVGGGFTSQLGLTAGVEAGVNWDWLNTSIYSRGYANKIDNFISEMIGPDLEMSGTATVEPYFEVRPGLRVAKIVGVSVGLRAYVNGQATVTGTTDTNITADFLIKAGVKGVNPSLDIGIDVFGWYIGKNFPLAGTLFDNSTTIFNQQLVLARPPNPAAFTPKFSITGGTFNNDQNVILTSDTQGATFRYTLDGSEPTKTNGTETTGLALVDKSGVLRAIAYKNGMSTSLVSQQTYNLVTSPVQFDPPDGLYTSDQTVSMSSETTDSSIYYTLDGSTPTTQSILFTDSPVEAPLGTTIRAVAVKNGYSDSTITMARYLPPTRRILGDNFLSMALKNDNTVWTWGYNQTGNLGDGTKISRNTPQRVQNLDNVESIFNAGYGLSFARKYDGTVWAWGTYDYFLLLSSQSGEQLTPVELAITNVVSITSDTMASAVYALKQDGTVVAWGRNNYGQVGDGTLIDKTVPTQVTGLTNIIKIVGSYQSGLALKSDGTVWSWGRGIQGTLGHGSKSNVLMPTQIPGLVGIIDISGSSDLILALKNDGTVWGWGKNTGGALGDGTTTERLSPIQVPGINNITAISTSGSGAHSLILNSIGQIFASGNNTYGQFGNGNTNNSLIFIPVTGISNVVTIHAGVANSYAINDEGLYVWGSNDFGTIGDGTNTVRLLPTRISGF